LLDLYLPGLKQESDWLNLVGTGSGFDLDSKFAKQDWTRTQKNQSPNTSATYHRCAGPGLRDSSPAGFSKFWRNRIGSGLLKLPNQDQHFQILFFGGFDANAII